MPAVSMIVWDMGNVLFPFDRNRQAAALRRLPGCSRDFPEIIEFIDGRMEEYVAYETGKLNRAEFLVRLKEYLGTTAAYDELEEAYGTLFSRNEPVCEIAKLLASMSMIATNTDPSHLARVRRDYPDVMSLYPPERVADSVSLGVRKPASEFFSKLVRMSGQPAGMLLFFDDLAANVEAARRCGIQGVVFDGDVERVTAELRERGVEAT